MIDTKAAFEEFRGWWFAPEQSELRLGCAEGWGFRIWLASRAVIEIEHKPYCVWPNEEQSDSYINGWNDHADELTSHGIRIKGKTD